jgi:kinesin family protein 13
MLEIYNEKVQDLLVSSVDQQHKMEKGSLKIREIKKGEIYVQGLSKHPVDSYNAIASKMDEGYTSRSIGATLMN